jgi:hypothetical protein
MIRWPYRALKGRFSLILITAILWTLLNADSTESNKLIHNNDLLPLC